MINISAMDGEDLIQLKALLLIAHKQPISRLYALIDSEWNELLSELRTAEIAHLIEPDRLLLMSLLTEVMYD